jgi:hypothetical protein
LTTETGIGESKRHLFPQTSFEVSLEFAYEKNFPRRIARFGHLPGSRASANATISDTFPKPGNPAATDYRAGTAI